MTGFSDNIFLNANAKPWFRLWSGGLNNFTIIFTELEIHTMADEDILVYLAKFFLDYR